MPIFQTRSATGLGAVARPIPEIGMPLAKPVAQARLLGSNSPTPQLPNSPTPQHTPALGELDLGQRLWPISVKMAGTTDTGRDSDSLVDKLLATGNVLTAPILRPPLVPGDHGRLGKYRVMEKLGEGASSVVYRGFDKVLLRPVVLKVFRPGYDLGKDGKRDMMDEARIFALFSNDLIVGILDLCRDAGTFFLVLTFQ